MKAFRPYLFAPEPWAAEFTCGFPGCPYPRKGKYCAAHLRQKCRWGETNMRPIRYRRGHIWPPREGGYGE